MQSVDIVEERYDALPVFPLPNFVLFPHTMTRLHVFEPRYRAMAAEALATDRLLVLVGLRPGWEEDYYGSPPVHPIGSLCKIVNDERLDDGRYNLFVHAVARVRIEEIHQLEPYRTASVVVIPDAPAVDDRVEEAMGRLVGTVRGLMAHVGGDGAQLLGSVLGATRKPDILTHRIAAAIATEPDQRQRLLETPDIAGRAELLTELAGELLLRATDATELPPDALIN
jgi:Lon protease-like protein